MTLQNMCGEPEGFDIEYSRLWELQDEWSDDLVNLLFDTLNELVEYIEDHPIEIFHHCTLFMCRGISIVETLYRIHLPLSFW
jgi:hypothetical protein